MENKQALPGMKRASEWLSNLIIHSFLERFDNDLLDPANNGQP
jgi:hypothetical protein